MVHISRNASPPAFSSVQHQHHNSLHHLQQFPLTRLTRPCPLPTEQSRPPRKGPSMNLTEGKAHARDLVSVVRDPDGKMCLGHTAWPWFCRKRTHPTRRVPEKANIARAFTCQVTSGPTRQPGPQAEQHSVSSVCESPDDRDLVPLVSIKTGLAYSDPVGALKCSLMQMPRASFHQAKSKGY